MHQLHAGLTLVAPVKEGKEKDLRQLLVASERSLQQLAESSSTVLFLSAVVVPAQSYLKKNDLPPILVLTTSFHGPRKKHIQELLNNGTILTCIFKHCRDFECGMEYSFLIKHSKRSNFTSRYQCITKNDVEKELQLRGTIQDYLDKAQKIGAFQGRTATGIKTLIERHLRSSIIDYRWVSKRDRPTLGERIRINSFEIISYAVVLAILLTIILFPTWFVDHFQTVLISIAILAISGAGIGMILSKRSARVSVVSDEVMRAQAATQLKPVLNEMIAAAPLKPGVVRRYFFSMVLLFLSLSRYPISVPTVSTIRWLVTDKRRRLIFLSNYTNTTDFYVREFLNGAGTRRSINFMFSNGQAFPDSFLYVFKGIISDPVGYMNAVHYGQHVTQFWYAHHPYVTIDVINRNRKIRQGLFRKMDDDDARDWLKLL